MQATTRTAVAKAYYMVMTVSPNGQPTNTSCHRAEPGYHVLSIFVRQTCSNPARKSVYYLPKLFCLSMSTTDRSVDLNPELYAVPCTPMSSTLYIILFDLHCSLKLYEHEIRANRFVCRHVIYTTFHPLVIERVLQVDL